MQESVGATRLSNASGTEPALREARESVPVSLSSVGHEEQWTHRGKLSLDRKIHHSTNGCPSCVGRKVRYTWVLLKYSDRRCCKDGRRVAILTRVYQARWNFVWLRRRWVRLLPILQLSRPSWPSASAFSSDERRAAPAGPEASTSQDTKAHIPESVQISAKRAGVDYYSESGPLDFVKPFRRLSHETGHPWNRKGTGT
ncbi:hypothetical protein B0G82_4258 [Paraburkholderia sp. BL17N1]|nr:hypothetical protein B0G82_4258 [Paraburkholderia sp. BL17N1]